MSQIRPFVRDDIPQVADLHQWVFGVEGESVHLPLSPILLQAYTRYFEEIFFRNPWRNEAIPSLVCEGPNGKIVGFLGVMPRRMSLNGRTINVALSSQFIVDPGSRASGAGLRLLQTFLSGPQDLSVTDEANNISRRLWEGLGGTTGLLYSVHWTRPLRPSRYVASFLRRRRLLAPLAAALKPVCNVVDAIAARQLPRRFHLTMPQVTAEELSMETLLICLSEYSGIRSLWPEYDDRSLQWLLETIARNKRLGAFRKMAVRNPRGEVIGWYLYYLKPGGESVVAQIMARKNSINDVLDHLFYDAWRHDSVAVKGRLEPQFMQTFSEKYCLFDCGAPWMLIHSPHSDLLEAIHHGDALLSGLEGEMCMRFMPPS
jgi:hypothetical protein